MLITNHVLSGALVGWAAPGPVSAFGLGLASHFALDTVPHWGDDRIFLQVAVPDGLVGLAAMAQVARRTPKDRRVRVVAGKRRPGLADPANPAPRVVGRAPVPLGVADWHRSIQHESVRRLPQELLVAAAGALAFRALLRRLG